MWSDGGQLTSVCRALWMCQRPLSNHQHFQHPSVRSRRFPAKLGGSPILVGARLNTAEIRGHTNHDRPHWGRSSACRVPPDGWLSSIDLETSAEIPRLCSVHGLPHTRDSSRRANTQTISRPFKFDQPPCSSPASPPSPPLPLPNPDFIRNFGMSTAISARIGCDLTEI